MKANRGNDFDCVEMKRQGTRHVLRLTRGMSSKEEAAFWRKKTAKLRTRSTKSPAEGKK